MSAAKALIVVLAVLFASGTDGRGVGRAGIGKCPETKAMENFEPEKYLGKWYEYARFFMVWEAFGDCSTATYTDQTGDDGIFTIGVHNGGINRVTGGPMDAIGQAVFANPDDPTKAANLIVNFDSNPIKAKTTNYQVLSTNYTDYTVIWNCAQEPLDIEIQYAWILTREQFPPQELIDGIYQLMSDNGLEPEHFSITKQTDCPPQ